ncbi:hypothetical protein D3C78_201080 [compost metagenome]
MACTCTEVDVTIRTRVNLTAQPCVEVRLTAQLQGFLRLLFHVERSEGRHRLSHHFVARNHLTHDFHHFSNVSDELFLVLGWVNVELQRHAIHLDSTKMHFLRVLLVTLDHAVCGGKGFTTSFANKYFWVRTYQNI